MRAMAAVALLMQGGCLSGFEWEAWEAESGDTGVDPYPYSFYRATGNDHQCEKGKSTSPTTEEHRGRDCDRPSDSPR